MSDVTAGAGADGPDSGGSLSPVLLAALGIAALVALSLIAFVVGRGAGADAGGAPTASQAPVALTMRFPGDGSGRVRISPGDISCSRPCRQEFATGTRLTMTADAAKESTFEGWSDACDGAGRCSLIMDADRSLAVTFAESAADPLAGTDAEAPADRPAAPDCQDGRDNDGDGLTDSAQDAGCDGGSTEAGGDPLSGTTATTTTPPPAAKTDECADGRDNDRDGLTDSAQDPDCVTGTSEGGKSGSTTAGTTRPRSECRDGRDNDGDGLIDSAQDPGCEGDPAEAD